MKNILRLFCFGLIFCCAISFASEEEEAKPKSPQSVDCFSGYGLAKLREMGNYRLMPLFVDFNFSLKPVIPKMIAVYPGAIQFSLEPFINYVFEPNNNVEIGNNFLLKVGLLPENWKLQPYVTGGIGFIYLTQHTVEQSTQFNFNEFAGAGVQYYFKKNWALNLQYRYRHLSNAGMNHPNKGINAGFALCGITHSF